MCCAVPVQAALTSWCLRGLSVTSETPYDAAERQEVFLSEPRKFRAALVQLRTGRDVIHNIDAAAKLVREAKALGADYVQTPEQTSLMELDRKSLCGHIFEEEHDPALAAFRS